MNVRIALALTVLVTIRLAVTNATVAVDTMENNAKMVWSYNILTHNFPIIHSLKRSKYRLSRICTGCRVLLFRNIFTDINKCLNNPCLNNGTCYKKPGSFKCKCTSGYDGETCANGEKPANNEIIECSNSSAMLFDMLNFFLLITQYIGLAQCSRD